MGILLLAKREKDKAGESKCPRSIGSSLLGIHCKTIGDKSKMRDQSK